MARYRLGTEIVDAIRFDPFDAHRHTLPAGAVGILGANADNWAYSGCRFFMDTKHGRIDVHAGDYIFEHNGTLTCCKGALFESAATLME